MASTVEPQGLVLISHEATVPLDHARPEGEQITLFAREVAAPDGRERPFLFYFQGGPGVEAPRPMTGDPSWLARALQGFRVLMVDQRGTGLSSPVGTLPGFGAKEKAERLSDFRADAIVADVEQLRRPRDEAVAGRRAFAQRAAHRRGARPRPVDRARPGTPTVSLT